MPRIKASFLNQQGEPLSGLLETPEGKIQAYAILHIALLAPKTSRPHQESREDLPPKELQYYALTLPD